MWIGQRKEISSKTDVSSVSPSSERMAKWYANTRNVSFRISLRWSIYIINPVGKTKLACYTPHRRGTTVSLETNPLYEYKINSLVQLTTVFCTYHI